MIRWLQILLVLFVSVSYCATTGAVSQSSDVRPNFLIIMADDLGYSDVGAFGSEIHTPNLDNLAKEGVRLTNFYVAPSCSPTRAMLLTGMDHHLVGLGAMAERSDKALKEASGYEGYLTNKAATIAELLSDHGYHTYMAGKWHLGDAKQQGPGWRGFEKSFALMEGAGGHYNNTGYSARFPRAHYVENGRRLNRLPDNFYSTVFYTDKIIENIEERKDDHKPFFAYLAFTAPHWPLQAPTEAIEKYKGNYSAGYEGVYRKRIRKIEELGIVAGEIAADTTPEFLRKWRDLSTQEQAREARMMEIYAAMVDVMDQQIGRLLDYLKSSGQYENTLVIFLSDNGPESHYPISTPENIAWTNNTFDSSLQNMGKVGSFVYYSPEWARVSAAPFSMFKGYTQEGGIRAPAIVSYPAGNYEKGMVKDITSVRDIMPTVLELANVQHNGLYRGSKVYKPRGGSLIGRLAKRVGTAHNDTKSYGWELHGRRALRQGDWKIVWTRSDPRYPDRAPEWELFNLKSDPAELRNLAKTRRKKLAEMSAVWHQYSKDVGVQPFKGR